LRTDQQHENYGAHIIGTPVFAPLYSVICKGYDSSIAALFVSGNCCCERLAMAPDRLRLGNADARLQQAYDPQIVAARLCSSSRSKTSGAHISPPL